MNDIMIDVESLSLDPNAHLLSIAAVQFDMNSGEYGQVFYEIIYQDKTSGVIDAATVRWWMRQSEDAREEVWGWKENQFDLAFALNKLTGFIVVVDDPVIWQRGPMDYIWLESAYKRCGMVPAWSHTQWQDQRTACRDMKKNSIPTRYGTAHNALDDCYHQIDCLVKAVSFS